MKTIELHIFTNSTSKAPYPLINIILETYNSFNTIFKKNLKVTVWCDTNPNIDSAEIYIKELKKIFSDINISKSLVDGYIRAVKSSKSDYLFMLEHDWRILPTISNSLDEIIECMEENDLWYLIFHKFNNFDKFPSNKKLEEKKGTDMSFCLTNRVSNNPHVICRKQYLEKAIKYINLEAKGSEGLEAQLTKSPLTAAFYGALSQVATVKHLNGR